MRTNHPSGDPARHVGCFGGCDHLVNEQCNINVKADRQPSNAGGGSSRFGGHRFGGGAAVPSRAVQQNDSFRIASGSHGTTSFNALAGALGSQQSQNHQQNSHQQPLSHNYGQNYQQQQQYQGNGFAPPPPAKRQAMRPRTDAAFSSGEDGNAHPMCECQVAAARRMTKKAGPNKGRPFFSCSTGQCGFFMWVDANRA